MTFKTPLKRRLRQSEQRKQRYWGDPSYRLRLTNEKRIRAGKEPLSSVEQIGADFRAHITSRQRDGKGRFA